MEAKTHFLLLISFLAVNIQTSQQQQCLTLMDLIFLVDGSNSMGEENFDRQKKSLNGLVSNLKVSEDEVRVGMCLFSRIVNSVIELTGNKESFIQANSITEYPDEETRLDLAILRGIEMFNKTGRNSTVPKVMIAILDGVSTDRAKTLAAADLAKSLGITIFAIGITDDIDIEELTNISSPGTQVFITEDFLTLESVLNNATNRVCEDIKTTTVSPSTTTQSTTTQPTSTTTRSTTTQPTSTTTQSTTTQPTSTTTRPTSTSTQSTSTTTQSTSTSTQLTSTSTQSTSTSTQSTSTSTQPTSTSTPPTSTTSRSPVTTQKSLNSTQSQNATSDPRTTAGLCAESGHRENGVGMVAHPKDCDKYIQCYYDEPNDIDLGVVRNCPMGLHWNSFNATCTSPSEANCSNDRCKEECSTYKMQGACGAYWECEDGVSSPKCCQQNYTFVPDLGCQPDDTCKDFCGTEKWCSKCQKKPNWEHSAGYDVMILGGNMWFPRPCSYGDFDIVACDCTAPREHVCPADRVYNFTDEQTKKDIDEGDKAGIRVSDATYNPEGIVLGDKSAIHVSVNKASRDNQPFTLEFRFREEETFSPYGEILFSSGVNCGTAHSLLVSANDEFIFAEVKAGDRVSEVKVPLKGLNPDEFKDLVLSYHEGVLALSIKDEQTQYIARTDAPDNLCFSCGIDIGQGLNKLSFDGEIEKIAIYSCAWKLLY